MEHSKGLDQRNEGAMLSVPYIAPDGHRLKTVTEVQRYARVTKAG